MNWTTRDVSDSFLSSIEFKRCATFFLWPAYLPNFRFKMIRFFVIFFCKLGGFKRVVHHDNVLRIDFDIKTDDGQIDKMPICAQPSVGQLCAISYNISASMIWLFLDYFYSGWFIVSRKYSVACHLTDNDRHSMQWLE